MSSSYNIHDLPPLPPASAPAAEVCAVIRLYLAVEADLSPAQARAVAQHLRTCTDCTREQQMLRQSSRLVASLAVSTPSERVDRAVLAAIAARQSGSRIQPRPINRRVSRGRRVSLVGLVAAAAALVLAVLTSAYFVIGGNPFAPRQAAFQLPANLSWDKYVLYYTQTKSEDDGTSYQVVSYYDMSNHNFNVKYVIPGKMEVMVVADQQKALGLDMMHHVAEWGTVDQWNHADLSLFDLPRLRQDLQNGRAVYTGKDHFKGQEVYRIRYPDGHVLLLDMQYMPVNVLQVTGQQEKPLYDTIRWLSPSQVSSSTWDMTVPTDFKMGELPSMPES